MLNEILQMKPPQDEPGPALQTDGKLLLWPRNIGHSGGPSKSWILMLPTGSVYCVDRPPAMLGLFSTSCFSCIY